jgi:hypothetical protein
MSHPIQAMGGAPGMQSPIWHPPIESRWIAACLIVFAGAMANRMPMWVLHFFASPIGFFLTTLVALASYTYKFVPGSFAIFFFLLLVWSAHRSKQLEGFLHASNTVDWVTNSQRWYVEKVLKERPLGIQEKGVDTFPVQGVTN